MNRLSKEENKALIDKYPFLLPRNSWTGEVHRDYDYQFTALDMMSEGWQKAFGLEMCEEIKQALLEIDYLDKYRITQIKEKYGELRWYDAGSSEKILEIIKKYTDLSRRTCIVCGETATKITTGWISPYCDVCAKVITDDGWEHVIPIEEFYKRAER